MTDAEDFRDLQVRIERYRALQREVTDPLAACLLRDIVFELEANLGERRLVVTGLPPGAPKQVA